MKEKWLPIPNFPYEVSSLGRVRRCTKARGAVVGRIISPMTEHLRCRYPKIRLWKNNKEHRFPIHSLVARAFLGSRPSGKEINHIDGNRLNASATNLEYVTRSKNAKHAFALGLRVPMCGEKNGRSKLIRSQIPAIRKLIERGILQREIASLFGVDQTTISRIKIGAWT